MERTIHEEPDKIVFTVTAVNAAGKRIGCQALFERSVWGHHYPPPRKVFRELELDIKNYLDLEKQKR